MSRRPDCKHFDGKQCQHPTRPFGRWPVDVQCAHECQVYDGPPRPAFFPVTFSQGALPVKKSSGCSPCAAAARQRAEKRKHDATEAPRILDQALTDAGNEDTL
jgi:hypothetical protein